MVLDHSKLADNREPKETRWSLDGRGPCKHEQSSDRSHVNTSCGSEFVPVSCNQVRDLPRHETHPV